MSEVNFNSVNPVFGEAASGDVPIGIEPHFLAGVNHVVFMHNPHGGGSGRRGSFLENLYKAMDDRLIGLSSAQKLLDEWSESGAAALKSGGEPEKVRKFHAVHDKLDEISSSR